MSRLILPAGYRKRERGFIINPFAHAVAAYSTWDSANKDVDITLSGANLVATAATTGSGSVKGTLARSTSENRYFEVTVTHGIYETLVGIGNSSANVSNPPGTSTDSVGWYTSGGTGYIYYGGGLTAYGSAFAVGDVVGIHLSSGTLIFYKNGAAQATARTGLSGDFYPMVGFAAGSASDWPVWTLNTGGSAFTASLPSGATAWG